MPEKKKTTRTASNIGRQNKRRGKEFMQECAERFQAIGFEHAHVNPQGAGGKKVGPDLAGIPLAVECKRTRSSLLNAKVRAAYDQAVWDEIGSGGSRPPVVLTRCDASSQVYAILTLEDLGRLILAARQGES